MSGEAGSPINVALGFDRAYAPHAAALIASLVRHAPGARFAFFVLHADVGPSLQAQVEASAPGASFGWREIGANDVPAMADREHFSRAILFRLGLEALAPADWTRALYLDVDMIVAADVRPLWRTDLGGAAVGAVADCYVQPEEFAARWGLEGAAGYFNSGMLLIDLEQVRRDGLFKRAIAFVADNLNDTRFTDQDALNYACWGRWLRLDPCWNVQRHMVIPSLIGETPPDRRLGAAKPAIVHFTGPEKPWLARGYHPWAWLYWDNLKRTPLFDAVAAESGIGFLQRARLWQRYIRASFAALGGKR